MDMNKLAQKAATKEQKLVEDATGGMLHRLNVVLGDDSKLNPTQRIALANGLERLLHDVEMGRNVPLSLGSSTPAPAEATTENSTTAPAPTPAPTPQSTPTANPAEAARLTEFEDKVAAFVSNNGGTVVLDSGKIDIDASLKTVTEAHNRKVAAEVTKASKPDTHIEKAKVWDAIQKVQPHLLDGGEGFHNALLGNKSISKENLDKLRGTFGVVENMVKPAGA